MATAGAAGQNGPAAGPVAVTTEGTQTESLPSEQTPLSTVPPSAEVSAVISEAAVAPATPAPLTEKRWPGWPGQNAFRLIVPVAKVGSIIGRKGELIKKMSEETRARIRILEGPVGTTDRIVLISAREEPETPMSPAMNGVMRVFRRVNGLSETDADGSSAAGVAVAVCSVRLLVSSSQAINLIGKQGSLIKSIQETAQASVRVLSGDELPFYVTSEERIVEIQGESPKVSKGLEAVIGHLRKFLVDQSVIPIFEKSYQNNPPVAQDRLAEPWIEKPPSLLHTTSQTGITNDYPISLKRDSLFLDRDGQLDSQVQHSGVSLYGPDPTLSGLRPPPLSRPAGPIVTQITQTMQIPLSYAEDIIGIGGANIGYIRRTSGAILTVQESRGLPDEITVEIKGTSSQVQTAQQLIHEFISGQKDSAYGKVDAGLRPYSQLGGSGAFSSSSMNQSYGGGYGSGLGGFGNFRP
ncbi:hypothetical protein Sjap_023118 [Stephania japonica]|uniref:K Homology domain-containing protein n=1 Tax=Stephania japonica TaxID=461633 RepID=A0AAP0HV15_9MAGN